MEEKELKIKVVKLDEIKPYEKNPRRNDDAVDAVAESIRQFGFKQPIVVDKNMVIVAGHTRYKAAQKLGLDKVPCIMADDLTEEQIKAYRLADNKTAELAGWDFGLLDEELSEIFDIDMSVFGFNETEDIGEDFHIDRHEAAYKESISVIVKCNGEMEAEKLFNRLSGEGFDCTISTL